jgi:hypothetical protein
MLAAGTLTAQLGLTTLLNAQGLLYVGAAALAALGLATPLARRRRGLSGNPARWWSSS